jgi:hypothetical protein
MRESWLCQRHQAVMVPTTGRSHLAGPSDGPLQGNCLGKELDVLGLEEVDARLELAAARIGWSWTMSKSYNVHFSPNSTARPGPGS